MSKILSPGEWLEEKNSKGLAIFDCGRDYLMSEYGKYVRDTTLEVAAEEANAYLYADSEIDKDFILELKSSEELKI